MDKSSNKEPLSDVGIAGISHLDSSRPVVSEMIRRMCDTMAHRGPDDFGHYVNGQVGLGMRGLSIIDAPGGTATHTPRKQDGLGGV